MTRAEKKKERKRFGRPNETPVSKTTHPLLLREDCQGAVDGIMVASIAQRDNPGSDSKPPPKNTQKHPKTPKKCRT